MWFCYPSSIFIIYFFKLNVFSGGSFNHHDDDAISELTSCAYGASHMALNESNADASNGSCNATNQRPAIGLFHRNATTFSSMQTNNSQPQDQYESSSHQHNLAGKESIGKIISKMNEISIDL